MFAVYEMYLHENGDRDSDNCTVWGFGETEELAFLDANEQGLFKNKNYQNGKYMTIKHGIDVLVKKCTPEFVKRIEHEGGDIVPFYLNQEDQLEVDPAYLIDQIQYSLNRLSFPLDEQDKKDIATAKTLLNKLLLYAEI